ncbi:MAG: carboxypeptidase regulatory-like domain-containing protein [Pyrinomonadaceae bacterium]
MNRATRFIAGLAVAFSLLPGTSRTNAAAVQARNIISGTVFGESRRPVADIYVELFDDFNASLRRGKTDGSGRFTFSNLVDGRYRVKVLPFGTDYLEQSEDVVLTSVSSTAGSGSTRENLDIYLKLNPRATASPFSGVAGVVFAQDVPATAKTLYEDGIRLLRDKKEKEGFESLRKAIEIFPTYYLALDRLGAEYATRGIADRSYLQAGFVLLVKAVEVNPRGFSSLFGLGWTEFQLGMIDHALDHLKNATKIYGKNPDAFLWLGQAYRRKSATGQAEAAFKKANELTGGKASSVHWQLAGLYSDQKRYHEAADEFELFLKTEPKAEDAEQIRALIKQLRQKPPVVKPD